MGGDKAMEGDEATAYNSDFLLCDWNHVGAVSLEPSQRLFEDFPIHLCDPLCTCAWCTVPTGTWTFRHTARPHTALCVKGGAESQEEQGEEGAAFAFLLASVSSSVK